MAVNDFKAKVLRVNQIINSGSTPTPSPLLIYGLGSATDASGSFTAAHFAGTGSDVWMFVSGTQKSAGSAGSYGAVAFKGDVVVSGVLQIGEQASAASTPAADKGAIYSVTGNLFFKNDDGVESNLLSSSAGGSNQQVQFNDNGVLNGDTSLTYNSSTNNLTLTGSFLQGSDVTASGLSSHAQGSNSIASGDYSHAEGLGSTASGFSSHAEGLSSVASGYYSHAEGAAAYATGDYSHAEGDSTIASGPSSHAEGYNTIASATGSHAEGSGSIAAANYSHAAGRDTVASGSYSYVGGQGTISSGSYQHVIGRYNKRNNDTSLFVIGDGTGTSDAARSDIVRVNSGSSIGAGRVEVTGTLAATLGFTGSLTKLVGGGDYLVAGANITLTTGALGDVTIAATSTATTPAGSNTQVQYNNDGAFGAKSTFVFATGSDRLSVTHLSASTVTASFISPSSPLVIRPQGDASVAGSDVFFFVSGSTTDVSVFQGDLTASGSVRLKDTSDTVRVSLIPNGQISGSGALLAGGNITAGGSVTFGNGTLVTTSSTATIANVTATTVNFAGAATTLTMGATSGTGSIRNASVTLPNATLINLSSTSAVIIGHMGASGQNLTISSSNGNVLVEGTTFSVNNVSIPGVLEVTGSATGSIARFQQLSGSLTRLQDGTTNYLEAGSGISITTGSNGQVTIAGGGGVAPYNAYTTTVGSPFTLAIPDQCSIIEIEACGGGGGGGSGRRAPLGNNAYGGGGGSGASRVFYSIAASPIRAISTNLTITIGAGGNGGAAQTSNNTDGLDGVGGGNTTVAAGATTLVTATGGALGKGGTAASAPGGTALFSQAPGGDGGAGRIPAVASESGKNAIYAGGGGAGGGRDAANPGALVQPGGVGGSGGDLFADNVNRRGTAGGSGGGTGGNATVPANPNPTGGGGGGGGGSANGVAGGAGGNGVQGGGGGGGGACTDGFNSGAGGKGGDGWCIVRFF